MLCLGIGAFLFAVQAAKDAKNNLKAINQNAKTSKNRAQILKQFAVYIQFHSKVKKLSSPSKLIFLLNFSYFSN